MAGIDAFSSALGNHILSESVDMMFAKQNCLKYNVRKQNVILSMHGCRRHPPAVGFAILG
jgi:hypothetical protein